MSEVINLYDEEWLKIENKVMKELEEYDCLLYTSPSPRD